MQNNTVTTAACGITQERPFLPSPPHVTPCGGSVVQCMPRTTLTKRSSDWVASSKTVCHHDRVSSYLWHVPSLLMQGVKLGSLKPKVFTWRLLTVGRVCGVSSGSTHCRIHKIGAGNVSQPLEPSGRQIICTFQVRYCSQHLCSPTKSEKVSTLGPPCMIGAGKT